MKNISTKNFLLSVFFGILLCTNIYPQMPPNPTLLEKIKRGEKVAPFTISNLNLIRSKGVDVPWTAPELKRSQSQRPDVLLRSFGPLLSPSGNWKALVILVTFTDKASQVNANYFDNLLFAQNAGSVWDYYKKISYNNLDIITVNLPSSIDWLTAPQTYSYYVNGNNGFGSYPQNAQKLVEDAVNLADPIVDYSQYDNDGDGYVDALFVVHTGPGAEYTGSNNDIWSHQWVTNTPQLLDGVNIYRYSMEPEYWTTPGDMTIGVFAHELGHAAFGLPDLYDYDYSSDGLGNWSLMAGGSWNGPLGSSPAFPDAWSHFQMGYLTPTIVSSNIIGQTINNMESTPETYLLWSNGSFGNEYYLVENRQQISYDSYLPGNGLCIYHVDQAVATGNNNEWYPGHTSSGHYLVALEQADGLWNLEQSWQRGDNGDPYPGSTDNRTFNNSSIPNSRDYSSQDVGVEVSNISTSALTMNADFVVGYEPLLGTNLTWTGESGYESDGVAPNEGTAIDAFTFRVKYQDSEGEAPGSGFPKLYIKKSGVDISGSPFLMEEANSDPFTTGRIYTVDAPSLEVGTDYTYQFEAYDINNSIVLGEGAIEQNGPTVTFEQFTEQTSLSLPGVSTGSVTWGDFDNDNDLDFILTGRNYTDESIISKIYQNNAGTFNEVFEGSIAGVYNSAVAWADYDNDGDLDLLLTGDDGVTGSGISKIYQNTGNGFSEIFSGQLVGAWQAAVDWGDYDNDGDLDILIASGYNTKIYQNTGDGFIEVYSGNVIGVAIGCVKWGDYDNDGDLDIALTGLNLDGMANVSKIYQNTGTGFSEVFAGSLIPVEWGSVDWGDYDNDGDLDLLLTGYSESGAVSKIYNNSGSGFTEAFPGSLMNIMQGSAVWGDYDNDGDLDLLLTGYSESGAVSKIYNNTGSGFIEVIEENLVGVGGISKHAWGDYDNDGDLDILLIGSSINGDITKIYKNNNPTTNNLPAVPTNLSSTVNGQDITFNWAKSSDTETPQNGLKYNLVVGTTPGGVDIVSPMSNRSTGYRRVVSMGNTNHNNSWAIKGLGPGTYYWSVQAVDNNFAGSEFALEKSFIISSESFANLKIYLQGCYSNGVMTTSLNTQGFIPLSQPFNGVPWNYSGTEIVTGIPQAVVDWVMLELRTGVEPTSIVARRAAFLKSDGSVVDLDGISQVRFDGIAAGSYYVIVRQRNHLPIMSANPVTLSSTNTELYDFTVDPNKTYGGTLAVIQFTDGKWGMIAGDINGSGDFSSIDYLKAKVAIANGWSGYLDEDVNLSGDMSSIDYLRPKVGISNGYSVQFPDALSARPVKINVIERESKTEN